MGDIYHGKEVIDSGLYGIVRHPMYSATLILFLSMPLVLGSLYSFVVFLAYPFIIAKRIKHEEAFLEKELTEALNSAFSSARTAMQEKMKDVTGSLGIDLPAF